MNRCNKFEEITHGGANGMDIMMDMPVVSGLMIQQSAFSKPAEEIVAGLLRQVHNSEWPLDSPRQEPEISIPQHTR